MSERLRDNIALVDALTEFLHDECDMGGAATYHTKRVLDFIEDWPHNAKKPPPPAAEADR